MRYDKSLDEIDSWNEFVNFRTVFAFAYGRMHLQNLRRPLTEQLPASATASIPPAKRRKLEASVDSRLRIVHADPAARIGDDLAGKRVCVIQGSRALSIQKLRAMAQAFDATIVANPGN